MPILTIALNPSLDKRIYVSDLSLGTEQRILKSDICSGGKAVNVARTLKALKLDVELSGVAAGTSGEFLMNALKTEGLRAEWVKVAGLTRTNLTILADQSPRQLRLLEPGPDLGRKDIERIMQNVRRRLATVNAVVLSGSLPPGCPTRFYADLVEDIKRKNVMTVVDASGEPLKHALKAGPFLIKPNREEAQTVCGFRITSVPAIKKALHILASRSNIVLISLDKEGIAGTDGARTFYARGPVLAGSFVGCGDAALGGFLAGFFQGKKFEDCLRLSAACGAANVNRPIPGQVKTSTVTSFFKKIQIERL